MTFEEYQHTARQTQLLDCNAQSMMREAILGLCGEVGELADHVKKAEYQGHAMSVDACREELGDILWYIVLFADAFSISLDSIARGNVDKIRERYPDGFSVERSVNRG